MEKILERYERYSYAEKVLVSAEQDPQANWCHEYRKLKAKVEAIQKSQRQLMGEELDSLNLKELQQLEQQLENSIKHIRSRKSQVMLDSISDLQRKEKSLQEENKMLQKELVEKQKMMTQATQWEHNQQHHQQRETQQQHQQYQHNNSTQAGFLLSDSLPSNISTYQGGAVDVGSAQNQAQAQVRVGLPSWMVRHPLNG
ncbi:hypothetical protein LUZ60_010113 [Juncus effusus]|nr:hypothetical protein LUZ60_010113 [Juncus effusus]